ncbi:DNA transfer protein [Arsenophonus endosymbiont of Aleurodicus floccissimus]|nr:DNA transfer protein [Arsenophonus endosymbiont of Aleurodicus floccissimus]
MGSENYFDIQYKMARRDIDREQLTLTMRGQNISAQNAALEREIKKQNA